MIANKDELIKAYDATDPGSVYPYTPTRRGEFLNILDWLSEQGFALVPREPTEDMYDVDDMSGIEAANIMADILTKPRDSE